jgi:hypothetical protein
MMALSKIIRARSASAYGRSVFGAVMLITVIAMATMTWVGFSSPSEDGFYHGIPCTPSATSKQVEIMTAGFSGTCVATSGGSVRFANRLTTSIVTLCLGTGGQCVLGKSQPTILRRGLILKPGESKSISFPAFHQGTLVYPLTLARPRGVTFTYPDSVVNSHQDPPGIYDRQP